MNYMLGLTDLIPYIAALGGLYFFRSILYQIFLTFFQKRSNVLNEEAKKLSGEITDLQKKVDRQPDKVKDLKPEEVEEYWSDKQE